MADVVGEFVGKEVAVGVKVVVKAVGETVGDCVVPAARVWNDRTPFITFLALAFF